MPPTRTLEAPPAGATPTESWRRRAGRGLRRGTRGLGPASLVLYDVSTLYFETDTGDGFREPGFSKERRLEPQITIGLLTDAAGFPLMVEAFEGNKAETTTMLPTIAAFMAAHQLADVTVVADAGMVSDGQPARRSRPPGCRSSSAPGSPTSPTSSQAWRREHPGEEIPDGQVFTQPWPAGADRPAPRPGHLLPVPGRPGPAHAARDRRAGRQGRESRRRQGAGQTQPVRPAHRRRPRPSTATLEAKARALAGIKGYVTNLHLPRRHPSRRSS